MTSERQSRMEAALRNRQASLTVVFENVHDPHNISAVLRTADSVGIQDVHIIRNWEPDRPKKLGHKSSGSARRWLTVHEHTSAPECLQGLRDAGFEIWATHLSADALGLYEMDFTKKIALLFGNEIRGVSAECLPFCAGNFVIPQVGMVKSLNISVACAVSLYEAHRQRAAAGMYGGADALGDEVMGQLRGEWGCDLED